MTQQDIENTRRVLAMIADERVRQIDKGWSPSHDDEHDDGSILSCAAQIIYDLEGGAHRSDPECEDDPEAAWNERVAAHVLRKYGQERGQHPIERMVVAAALIVAEIERLKRSQ